MPRRRIGTCQTGKLCTIGLDWVLLLARSLSLVLPPAPLLAFPSLSALQANVLAELQASCCQIGGPYSCWQRLRQWLRKERGERASYRERERELERKGVKKAAALGFASGPASSSNIDSVLFFFSPACILCFALASSPHPPPRHACARVCLRYVCAARSEFSAGSKDLRKHSLLFAKDFFFFPVLFSFFFFL